MPGRPYRVLAVDDEPEVTRLLGALLRGADYDTRTAAKAGAFTFVPKGGEPDALLTHVASALEHKRLVDENRALQQQLRDRFRYANIIGKSRKMHDLLDLV